MFLCFYSARHCQFVATMAFVRRFCTSSELGYHLTTRHISKWLTCTAHTSSHSHISPTVPASTCRWQKCHTQHVYFSKFPSAKILHERGTCKWSPIPRESGVCLLPGVNPSQGRWHSLHWDRRESSLMCLKDSARCSSVVPRPSYSHQESLNGDRRDCRDLKTPEPPVLFSIERGTINHALSTLMSTLPVQDGLKDITATLRRLSATMHLQSVLETAAKPWDQECSDDIIIRNSQPTKPHGPNDIMNNHPIRRYDYDCTNQPSNHLGATSLTETPISDRVMDAHIHRAMHVDNANRRHLYLNKLQDDPVAADVPKLTPVQSLAGDSQPPTARAETSLPGNGGSVSPHSNDDTKPSKEQILLMYDRLAAEMPNFLLESHDFSMYANTVVFDNRIMKFKTKGLPAYKVSIQGLKYLYTAYMMGSTMEVLRLTAELELGIIHARWRLKGVPIHSYILTPWRRKHPDRYFDAFSTFELGADGLIHLHKLDKVMPTPSDKMRAPSIATRIGIALGLVRNPALSPNCMVPKPLSFMQEAKTSTDKL